MSANRSQPTLRDPEADRTFATEGVVAVPFFDHHQLAALRTALDPLDLWGAVGFHDTASADVGADGRRAVHQILCAAFEEAADGLLADYRPVMSALLVKWPGDDGAKEIHRDLQLVDETRFRAVCVWVPLVDVDERNGALRVLRGSQHVDTGPRSVPTTPDAALDPLRALDFDELDTIEMRAGDAAVFDLAVAHGSDRNQSDQPRHAVGVAYVPRQADLSLRFCHEDDRVELLEVDDPDALRRIDWRVRPPELRSLGFLPPHDPPPSAAELVRRSRTAASQDPTAAAVRSDAGRSDRHRVAPGNLE